MGLYQCWVALIVRDNRMLCLNTKIKFSTQRNYLSFYPEYEMPLNGLFTSDTALLEVIRSGYRWGGKKAASLDK